MAFNYTLSDLVYHLVLLFVQLITSIFFREIKATGGFNIPREGPVIFAAAPHNNQFVDLIWIIEAHKATRRKVQTLVAAASMQRGFVGFVARMLHSIPVVRASDEAKPGTGRVGLSQDDPCLVVGYDTKFTSDFKPRMTISLPKSVGSLAAEVVEVISDTELKIKKEFGGEGGKGTARVRDEVEALQARGEKGLTFKKIPFIDQHEMYQHVYDSLKNGGAIGIFPEGGSHDRTDLLPLKAGVSLMALGAMAANPDVKVKIVPVGLSYFHAHKFRSRTVIEFGSPIDIPPELVDMYSQGGAEKRKAVANLLDIIYGGLKAVTVRAPDYDTLMMIQATRRLYTPSGPPLDLSQVVELNKRFLAGYMAFKDDPRVISLKTNVVKYNRRLRDLGVRDHQVTHLRKAGWEALGLFLYRWNLLVLWTVFALPGVVLNSPIFITAKLISIKKSKEALAASSVKLAGRDVLATWKIMVSLGLTPVVYLIYACLAELVAIKANSSMRWRILAPIAVCIIGPLIAFAALKFGEAGMDVLKSLRPLIAVMIPGQQRELDNLKNMRKRLSQEIHDLVDELGPTLFENFNQIRIIPSPHSTPRPDSDGQTLATAKAVDPSSWLDHRWFGWTTTANGSNDDSKSEDNSDDEGEPEADFDYLIPFLDGQPSSERQSRGSKPSAQKVGGDDSTKFLSPFARRDGGKSSSVQSADSLRERSSR